jgi:peptidoglycan/LPS O-acetylase OafA/YrhL
MSALAELTPLSVSKPKRILELDGLRAFAILPVILHHCHPTDGFFGSLAFFCHAGWMGVDLFFVLSGYLISGILLDTVDRPHYYRNFIVRRSLRIFPLYYICLAIFTIAAWLNGGPQWADLQNWGVGWFVVYLGNIRAALVARFPRSSGSPRSGRCKSKSNSTYSTRLLYYHFHGKTSGAFCSAVS